MPEKKIYLSPIDALELRTRGCNAKDGIEVMAKSFQKYTLNEFLELVDFVNPEYVVSLTEEKRPPKNLKNKQGIKGDRRAVKKSINFLKIMIKFFKEKMTEENQEILPKIIAPLVGGEYEKLRGEMLDEILQLKDNIDGVTVMGLGVKNGVVCQKNFEMIQEKILKSGFEGKLILSSEGSLLDLLYATLYGFDGFETGYPFEISKKGLGLGFSPKSWVKEFKEKKSEFELESDVEKLKNIKNFEVEVPLLNLNNMEMMKCKEDLLGAEDTPLPVKGYSKAYICHLLNNKELLGPVLLTMFNCAVYQEFVEVVESEFFRENMCEMIDFFLKFYCTDIEGSN